jgi:hypothetical protein
MKKNIIFGMVFLALTGSVFATEILPDLHDYIASKIGGDANLISLYPNTTYATEKLSQLRQGERADLIAVEWSIGPAPTPISSAIIELQKHQARVSLTASANSYVRGEVALLGYNEDMSAKIVTEVSASIIFAEMLKNNREELRLSYSYKNADGSTWYGTVFWLAIDKASLDGEIGDKAAAVSSGNYRADKKAGAAEQKTAEIRKPSQQAGVTSDNEKLVKSVQTLMASDERIQRFREENRQLLGFGDE